MGRMMLVRTTVASEDDAAGMARRLVAGRTACCVHTQPVKSVYRWEGNVEDGTEWLVEARAPEGTADALWDAMLKDHPYENPLVEMSGPTRVPGRYAEWAEASTARR